ncbi:hypothetical protein [Pontibacter roseus]|uniref:hypothetical protein n=1 Tax=Pontibacter roseus TaxID=336989 RepID=UPI000475CE90|nr:hypothetical protein [Pontibacter roseus]
MKFQRLLSLLFALLLVTSLTGCGKDDDKGPSNRDFLTAGTWTGNAIVVNGNDLTREFREDEEFPYDISQNTIKFDKAGTYLDSYGGRTDNGTWEFANGEKELLMDKGTTNEYTLIIDRLNDKELFLYELVDDPNMGAVKFELRFVR